MRFLGILLACPLFCLLFGTRHETDGETWFTLRDMPEAKKMERKNRADIEYLAMMTDNELEEDEN